MALGAFAVGIQRRRKAAAGQGHLVEQEADRCPDAGAKAGGRLFAPQADHEAQHASVHIEHFFEVGREPGRVHHIAVKATANMVVHALFRHLGDRGGNGFAVFHLAGGHIAPPQKLHRRDHGKFGRAAEAAFETIDLGKERRRRFFEMRQAQRAGGGCFGAADHFGEAFGIALDIIFQLCITRRDVGKDAKEAGAATPRFEREIGAAPDRLGRRRQNHVERPARWQVQGCHGGLEVIINGGQLFAVNQDREEIFIDARRHGCVGKTFAPHHVAPMTGKVADGQKYGLFLAPCFAQVFFVPGAPLDRVLGMKLEIGTGFEFQKIELLRPAGRRHQNHDYNNGGK